MRRILGTVLLLFCLAGLTFAAPAEKKRCSNDCDPTDVACKPDEKGEVGQVNENDNGMDVNGGDVMPDEWDDEDDMPEDGQLEDPEQGNGERRKRGIYYKHRRHGYGYGYGGYGRYGKYGRHGYGGYGYGRKHYGKRYYGHGYRYGGYHKYGKKGYGY